jgi:hypothetical protein
MRNRLGVRLLDQSVDTGGSLVGGLVKEGHDILRAVLEAVSNASGSAVEMNSTSPKNRLNMFMVIGVCFVRD